MTKHCQNNLIDSALIFACGILTVCVMFGLYAALA